MISDKNGSIMSHVGAVTVLDKMNELTNSQATIQDIKNWAYRNRIVVMSIADEDSFEPLAQTVDTFIEAFDYHGIADEHAAWDAFLAFTYIEK